VKLRREEKRMLIFLNMWGRRRGRGRRRRRIRRRKEVCLL